MSLLVHDGRSVSNEIPVLWVDRFVTWIDMLVTEGDFLDEKMSIKHVFVDGRPVNLEAGQQPANRRGSQ